MISFKNAKIVLADKIINNGCIEIDDGRIKAIGEGQLTNAIDLHGQWILPGFIDGHVHGGYGVDFETGNKNRFSYFAQKVVREGVTSYLQTSVTSAPHDLERYLEDFNNFLHTNYQGARCLGLHLEGPFLSAVKKGAHDTALLLKPNINLVRRWNKLVDGQIKIVTYAPEEQDGSFTKSLIDQAIIPSAGHSNITCAQFSQEYQRGIRHVTHLFNGMSGIDQFHPGLALGALIHRDVLVETISDGIHLSPSILQFIYRVKGADNICIITDAMNAKGLADGNYFLGKLPIIKHGIKATLRDINSLAGSCSTYDYNVRFYQKICQISMVELIKMTSINLAKQLDIFDQTGSIDLHKKADLVILNDRLEVQTTIVDGQIVFER